MRDAGDTQPKCATTHAEEPHRFAPSADCGQRIRARPRNPGERGDKLKYPWGGEHPRPAIQGTGATSRTLTVRF